jgi:hypothetical protein
MKPGLINVVFNFPALLKRQLPNNFSGEDEGWRFTYNLSGKCDYLVVFDDLPKICQFEVSSGVIILICTEPSSVRTYGTQFLSQFTHIISTHETMGGNIAPLKNFPPPIPWHIGWNHSNGNLVSHKELKSSFVSVKEKKLSIVCSPKTHTVGHHNRLNFIHKFINKTRFSPDVYGLDKPFDDKIDALISYQFTLVIENTRESCYWTEKLSDAFIAETFPLYYGDPNASTFFDPKSFFRIDSITCDVDNAIEALDDFIETTKYDEIRPSLLKSKNAVMEKYEFHNCIVSLINRLAISTLNGRKKLFIAPEKYYFIDKMKFYKRTLWNTRF